MSSSNNGAGNGLTPAVTKLLSEKTKQKKNKQKTNKKTPTTSTRFPDFQLLAIRLEIDQSLQQNINWKIHIIDYKQIFQGPTS